MLTPNFSLSQTADTLIVTIRVPYCSIGEMEVDVIEDCLMFTCFPYYLELNLPGSVHDNCENTSYCFISDSFEIILEKKCPDEEFKDLDIYPKLLINNKSSKNKHKPNEEMGLVLDEEDDSYKFGFAMKGNRRFASVAHEFLDLFDIDPTKVAVSDRRNLTIAFEQRSFNSSQYLVDLIDEDTEILDVIQQKSPWNVSEPNSKLSNDIIKCDFEENDFFKNHPKTVLDDSALTNLEKIHCQNGLIDILFAYCYDRRTTYFEGSCEAAWTISKLAATLSCFCVFESSKEAMVSAYRRSLIYPLFRNFSLTEMIFEDLKNVLRLKRDYVVKCFLNIYDIFAKSGYYILNTLYINDYIHYVKFSEEDVCEKALQELEKIKLSKSELGLRLHLFEELTGIATTVFNNYPVSADDSDDDNEEEEQP